MRTTGSRAARAALYGFLGTWAVLITLNQDPRRKSDLVQRLNPGGMCLPDWRFFAPNPGTHDYHLLVRDEFADGGMTLWTEVELFERRRAWHVLIHPNRRLEKAIYDAVGEVVRYKPDPDGAKEDIQLSLGYLNLLNYVTHNVPHHPDAVCTQFFIAESNGFDEREEPYPLFVSNPHPLDDSRTADVPGDRPTAAAGPDTHRTQMEDTR